MRSIADYRILRRLGNGVASETFLVESKDRTLGVLKTLKPNHLGSPYHRLFLREIAIQQSLHVGGVPRLLHVSEDGVPYFVQENIAGFTLRGIIISRRRKGKPLPVTATLQAFRSLLLVLDSIHSASLEGRGLEIVHRDISPSNVLLTPKGRVYVIDFGIAKSRLVPGAEIGTIKGKWSYMAPEQILGLPVDARADVFACGALLFEMLSGQSFRKKSTEHEVVEGVLSKSTQNWASRATNISDELLELIAFSTASERDKRLESARRFLLLLNPILSKYGVRPVKVKAHSHFEQEGRVIRSMERDESSIGSRFGLDSEKS